MDLLFFSGSGASTLARELEPPRPWLGVGANIVILEADKNVKHVQVDCEAVVDMGYMGQGTLLQSAVKEDQEDFVQILMDFG